MFTKQEDLTTCIESHYFPLINVLLSVNHIIHVLIKAVKIQNNAH